MPFDPDSPSGRARLAAIRERELRRPPRVFDARHDPSAGGQPVGPPSDQETSVPSQNTERARGPLPSGKAKTTVGRLMFLAGRGDERAKAELERRGHRAGGTPTTGGAA